MAQHYEIHMRIELHGPRSSHIRIYIIGDNGRDDIAEDERKQTRNVEIKKLIDILCHFWQNNVFFLYNYRGNKDFDVLNLLSH